jgi:hypothetical protein
MARFANGVIHWDHQCSDHPGDDLGLCGQPVFGGGDRSDNGAAGGRVTRVACDNNADRYVRRRSLTFHDRVVGSNGVT